MNHLSAQWLYSNLLKKEIAMSKDSNLFSGQPSFKQIASLLDKAEIGQIAKDARSDRYVKKLDTYSHLLVMLYGIFSDSCSLRELVLGCLVDAGKLGHLGIDFKVCRSTLAEANARRDSTVFESIYIGLYERYRHLLPDSRFPVKDLYAFDSTTITLFCNVLKGCDKAYEQGRKAGKRKGGIKVHSLIKASEGIPCLARLDAAAVSDSKYMREIGFLGKGSMATFDKGYSDHEVLEEFSGLGIYYTTRLKDNVKYETAREVFCSDDSAGVARDEHILISLRGREKKHSARRIEYISPDDGKKFVFLTNNFKLKAATIAKIYRKRWKIELMFKKLKQNFQLKYFYGDSANAIEIQVWCVLIACLLMAVFRAANKIQRISFSNMMFVVRRVLMEYVWLHMVLAEPERTLTKMLSKQNRAQAPPSLFD
ncbi:transposase [Fibrobacteria bacterium R8-3-H12]